MRIDFLTIFPEMFPPVLGAGVVGRAIEAGIAEVRVHNVTALLSMEEIKSTVALPL